MRAKYASLSVAARLIEDDLGPLGTAVPEGDGDQDKTQRSALAIGDPAYHVRVDRECMATRPARTATVTYRIGERALTSAAMRLIIKHTTLAAAGPGPGSVRQW